MARNVVIYYSRVWGTKETERELFSALKTGRGIGYACRRARVCRSTVYRRVHMDADFAREFEIARLQGTIERTKARIRRLRSRR